MLVFKQGSQWVEWIGQQRPLNNTSDLYKLPLNAEAVFTTAELALYGLQKALPPDDVSADQNIVGFEVQTVNGVPKKVWLVQVMTLEEVKAKKLSELSTKRYEIETGGMTFSGMQILTDRQTSSIITAAYVTAKSDPNYSIRWKVRDGLFVTLNATTLIFIAEAVRAHVQACYLNEDNLTTQILALNNADAVRAFNINGGWPSN